MPLESIEPETPRIALGTYATYVEAQEVVDRLSDRNFPVEKTMIVGEGLKFVEQVTGRLNWGKAALQGAGGGALIGFFIGALLGLFVLIPEAWLELLLWSLALGIVFGGLLGLLSYAMTGGRRDFQSVGAFTADRYHVMVDSDAAADARRLLESAES